jgi:hypothetical protein
MATGKLLNTQRGKRIALGLKAERLQIIHHQLIQKEHYILESQD